MADEEQNGDGGKDSGLLSVTSRKVGVSVEFEKDFGANLEEAEERYGHEVVFSLYNRQAVIACQARVRGVLDKGGSKEDAIKAGTDFVPGVVTRTRTAKDPVAELAKAMHEGKIDASDLEEHLKQRLAELQGG